MRSIFPSAAVIRQKYALVSSLKAQGLSVADDKARPAASDTFLVMDGETPPIAARTLVIAGEGRGFHCATDNSPARLAFGAADAAIGNAFAHAYAAGPDAPTAADPESLALFALAERVADADITVLVNGPTGTGKEVIARTIHRASSRRDKAFIAINCAALPETMLEAMLFGHQKGAFTGASSGGDGFFRAADGGTLLLDEIAEMPLGLQAKLLRVLQEREVIPIGATQAIPVDVRIIACANRDLQEEVAAGRFRADLYYRLSVFPLDHAPARRAAAGYSRADRGDDPAPRRHAPVDARGPTTSAVEMLMAHDWPGNVRELENVIQRALLFAAGDTISREPYRVRPPPDAAGRSGPGPCRERRHAGERRPVQRIPRDPRNARRMRRQPDRNRQAPRHFGAHLALSPRQGARTG